MLRLRPHRRQTKPVNTRPRYDRGFWGRHGAAAPGGFWAFTGAGRGGKVTDYSENGNDGTLGSGVSWSASPYGQALVCPGTVTPVDCGNGAALQLGTGDFTMLFWGQFSNSGAFSNNVIVCKGQITSGAGSGVFFNDFSNFVQFLFNYGPNSYTASASISSSYPQWCHMAAVKQGSSILLYLNGALVATTTGVTTIGVDHSAGVDFLIGSDGGRPLSGAVLQAGFWPCALSAEFIAKLYARPWAMFGRRQTTFGKTSAAAGLPYLIGGNVGSCIGF